MPRRLRALSSARPPLLPPQDRFLPAGLGVARPDSAPSADPRAPGAASPPRRPPGARPPPSRSPRAPRAPSLSRSPRQARSRPARSGLRLLPAPVSAVTALGNMATEGMILTNHDHQIRVGVLTGKPGEEVRGPPRPLSSTCRRFLARGGASLRPREEGRLRRGTGGCILQPPRAAGDSGVPVCSPGSWGRPGGVSGPRALAAQVSGPRGPRGRCGGRCGAPRCWCGRRDPGSAV